MDKHYLTPLFTPQSIAVFANHDHVDAQTPQALALLAALKSQRFAGVVTSYGGEQERVALLATVMANPVILLFRGLPSGAGESQMVVFLLLPWLLLVAYAAFIAQYLGDLVLGSYASGFCGGVDSFEGRETRPEAVELFRGSADTGTVTPTRRSRRVTTPPEPGHGRLGAGV